MSKDNSIRSEASPQQRKQLSRDEIARRAYDLWLGAGQPLGRDLDFWLQAEADLLNHKSNGDKPETRKSRQNNHRSKQKDF